MPYLLVLAAMSGNYYEEKPFEHAHESVQLLGRVLGVLEELPEPVAMAAVLRYLDGFEMEKVAKTMGVDPKDAAQLAYKGLRELKEANIIKLTNKQKRV